jgi:hypothetical protein
MIAKGNGVVKLAIMNGAVGQLKLFSGSGRPRRVGNLAQPLKTRNHYLSPWLEKGGSIQSIHGVRETRAKKWSVRQTCNGESLGWNAGCFEA